MICFRIVIDCISNTRHSLVCSSVRDASYADPPSVLHRHVQEGGPREDTTQYPGEETELDERGLPSGESAIHPGQSAETRRVSDLQITFAASVNICSLNNIVDILHSTFSNPFCYKNVVLSFQYY